MKTLDKHTAMRYNRQISLSGVDLDGQERLLNASVLVIGAGGLGCASLQNLAGAGIGKLTLVDDDIVEITNIHRQVLHQEADIGKVKVQSAKESLNRINSACDITTFNQRLNDEELLQQIIQHDMVLDCSDNLLTRNQLNRLCWQADKPLVSGAAIRQEGQVISFVKDDHLPCYQCLSALFGEQQLSCSEAGVMPPVVNIVGSMQAMEAIKILLNANTFSPGVLYMMDFGSAQWRTFKIQKQLNCEVCGT